MWSTTTLSIGSRRGNLRQPCSTRAGVTCRHYCRCRRQRRFWDVGSGTERQPDAHAGEIHCLMSERASSGQELEQRARQLGVDIQGQPCTGSSSRTRIIEAERASRESRLWLLALISAVASVVSALAVLGGDPSKMSQATAYRCRLRNSRSSSPVSASAFAGRIEASRSSTSSLNAAAIFATWMPNVPRNSPSALPKVQL